MLSRPALRCLLQPATALGVLTIALLWLGIGYQLALERDKLQAVAVQTTRNLARVVEEHVVRAFTGSDQILRLARAEILRNPDTFDLVAFAREAVPPGGVAVQLSVIGADGRLRMNSRASPAAPVDLSDRRHFQIHRDRAGDALDISPPVFGRVSGRWTLQLSRPLRGPDGAFLGVVVASLDADYFSQFYASIDVGKGGSIILVGTDGVVRAGAGAAAPLIGRKGDRPWPTIENIGRVPVGSVVGPSLIDGVVRFISFRRVEGLPLVVYASISAADALADNARYVKVYSALAAMLTLVVLAAVAFAVRQRMALERTAAALHASEAVARRTSQELAATLDNISQGIVMVDPAGRLAVVNRRAADLLGVPEETLAGRPPFADVVAEMARRGELGSARECSHRLVSGSAAEVSDAGPVVFERTRPNGQTIEVSCVPMPDGGMVRTYTDVTERRASERRIAYMALHDPLTGLANRTLFRTRLEEGVRALRERGAPFAVVSIDLDRFKEVNDAFGHPAGDALLQRVAHRLRRCLRDGDLAARLGGDELAVLAVRDGHADGRESLAAMILEALTAPYRIDGQVVEIGASLGLALAPEDGDGMEALLRAADQAMYRVKGHGRNGVCWAGRAPRFAGPSRREPGATCTDAA
ncbi:diguanylate cyclase [Rhodoplanes sp. TEM]|uniref:Diguanylate cyclase n=1 Tax=Rhodoplanes tepidamans TaxID=200616 RepID=A0ABT5JHT9_RHOTP|nr:MULTISPECIES: diguanylate cyclase [Rhodoplanes]MDC7789279.1 diguanylate cyclase [Rhodoplanes tepidamans]MDC7987800.1 diguanylate cyclase [Rhodoplanes sp. TEM]MDQ0355531.1 diguanylate cyclase (GGDEF)-like protein/PAS domain S-box-containing protein [Rhodoplanes tepidamans]